ncbi:hypothetical protein BGZ65_003088 [Modicella reniformis]|uniref:Uncharacterized protein n=1 Tax=Modicella reniformis TaxID=1440133 RepID=A0A9P6LZN7_9FUNG|nr:hypothetical protein BGZ65_003088 [Modicella reniformis]
MAPQTTLNSDYIEQLRQAVEGQAESGCNSTVGDDVPNPARLRGNATKVSLRLSSDSSSSEFSAISRATSSDNDELCQGIAISANHRARSEMSTSPGQENVVMSLAMVSTTPLNVISKAKLKRKGKGIADTVSQCVGLRAAMDRETAFMPSLKEVHEGDRTNQQSASSIRGGNNVVYPSTLVPSDNVEDQNQSSPQMPSLSSLSSFHSSPRLEGQHDVCSWHCNEDTGMTAEPSREVGHIESTKPASTSISSDLPLLATVSASESVLASIRSSSSASSFAVAPFQATTAAAMASVVRADAISASLSRPSSSLVSLPLQCWSSHSGAPQLFHTDSSASSMHPFTQMYLSSTFSEKKKITIPTIVIHPDEEDGEPSRVLSQNDIDYLSTMPPSPLRPLIQQWDDIPEEVGREDEMDNTGLGDDDYHQHYRESCDRALIDGQGHAEADDIDIRDRAFDSHALDVPALQEQARDSIFTVNYRNIEQISEAVRAGKRL